MFQNNNVHGGSQGSGREEGTSLLNQFQEKQSISYKNLLPYEKGLIAPRPGSYLIKKITFKDIGRFFQVPVAEAYWSKDGVMFLEGTEVQIQLLSLTNPGSIGPELADMEDLRGKVLQITEGHTHRDPNAGSRYHAYVLSWSISDSPVKILNAQDLFFKVFFQHSISVSDSLVEFNSTLPSETVAQIEDCESNQEEPYIEDTEDNDAPDAPDAETN